MQIADHGVPLLVDCTATICREIEQGFAQPEIAVTYALAIRSEAAEADAPDWGAINRAIMSRWSRSGLERIKRLAWQRLEPSSGA